MNRYYRYENLDLWRSDRWGDHVRRTNPLIVRIGQVQQTLTECPEYTVPAECMVPYEDPHELPYYQHKSKSVDDPAVFRKLNAMGLSAKTLEMGGGLWVPVVPQEAAAAERKFPLMLVVNKVRFSDPFWAMKLLTHYERYHQIAASWKMVFVYTCSNEKPDTDAMYANMLQEALVLYHGNPDRMYVDISPLAEAGEDLRRVEFCGDLETQTVCGIPAADISGRWYGQGSLTRELIMETAHNARRCDREWLIHTECGEKLMKGIALEYQYEDLNSPGYREYFRQMGLRLDIHETEGERWTAFVPMQALEEPEKKLPCMVVFQEVYYGNEHFALTAHSYAYPFLPPAAQGEYICLFFVLEDPDANQLLRKILAEAAGMYPIDLTRVYLTGHSHDGYFAWEFARRNPDLIAAIATLGNVVGLPTDALTGDPVLFMTAEKIEDFRKRDMPTINLAGCAESMLPIVDALYPYTDEDSWSKADFQAKARVWQDRLYGHRCPMKTVEEIAQCSYSPNGTARKLGIPADRYETVWLDGAEHYIADIRNEAGKEHLRIVCSENMPHMIAPAMGFFAWNFCRRFRRDPQTLQIEELY